ncbi:MAG: hypothetical protein ACLUHE_05100 [Christensenellales bacterium]
MLDIKCWKDISTKAQAFLLQYCHQLFTIRLNLVVMYLDKLLLVKPVDEIAHKNLSVNVDKQWTYSGYYYAGVGMRDDFLNVADTAVGNNTLSVIIGITNLLYSFVVDPIVDVSSNNR